MGKKIVILTQSDQHSPSSQEAVVGLLFQCAPDSEVAQRFTHSISHKELIGDIDLAKQKAADLTMRLLKNEPCFRGAPQLSIFEEVIIRELQQIFHLLHLADFLVTHGFSLIEFCSPSSYADGLAQLIKITKTPLKVIVPQNNQSKLTRWWRRKKSSRFSYSSIHSAIQEGVNFVDPLHRRSLWLNSFKHKKPIQKNQLWFYTTAVTYTNIGLLYEPFFPEPLHFLVENPMTGGKPLQALDQSFSFLYDFASPKFIPQKKELQQHNPF